MKTELIAAAGEKFGEVIATRPHANGGTVLLINRSEPANASVPYMTIRGIVSPDDKAKFFWGHYDMNEAEAHQDFDGR
jgi:hypothetical protein